MEKYASLEFTQIKEEIAQLCAFSLGKDIINELEPSFNPLKIKSDNTLSKDALNCLIKFGAFPFGGIRDIKGACQLALKDGTCTIGDLISVLDHYRGIKQIFSYLKNVDIKIESITDLTSSLEVNEKIIKHLENTFNNRGEISDSASPKLKSLKKRLMDVESSIAKESQRILSTEASKLTESIVATRNDRVVVLSKVSEKNSFKGIIHGESSSGQSVYVEPASLIPLNNEKQSTIFAIDEEIKRILFECSQVVKEGSIDIINNIDTLALLDSVFAKVTWGKSHNAIMCDFSIDKEIYLKDARHPLIDPKKVVSNTYRLSNTDRMLLITGPNTGGKTVALKTIGLFVIMSYCGIPVLSEEARLPIFDNIYFDIGDEQSIVNSLSTFSAHLTKLTQITNEATEASLVLLDELGNGTDPKEGEALAISVLEYLRNLGCTTIATTHYSGCKLYAKQHEDILVASVQFDIEKMAPTYKYIEGISGQSNAFDIARKYGLNSKIVDHAESIKDQEETDEDRLMERLDQQIQEYHLKNSELIEQLDKNKRLNSDLIARLDELDSKRLEILDKAKDEAQAYISNIKEEADELLEELLSSKETIKQHEINKFNRNIEDLVEVEEEIVEDTDFEVGDYVKMKNSSQTATIQSINGNQVILLLNGMKVTTKKDQIRKTAKPAPQKNLSKTNFSYQKKDSFSMECNLIGMRVVEGLEKMDKYLDDALLANMPSVRIIHGAGTGQLRKAVHENLSKRKNVEFRLGGQGEGGVGATVVTFKK